MRKLRRKSRALVRAPMVAIIGTWWKKYLLKASFGLVAKSRMMKTCICAPTASAMYTMRGINAAKIKFLDRVSSKLPTIPAVATPPSSPSSSQGRRCFRDCRIGSFRTLSTLPLWAIPPNFRMFSTASLSRILRSTSEGTAPRR